MIVLRHEKLRLDAVDAKLAEVDASVGRDLAKAKVIGVVGAVAALALCFPLLPAGVILGVVTAAYFFTRRDKLRRARDKVTFAREVHALLEDELHPRRAVVLDFDLRHYDEASKKVWSGRSSHGNAKYKYTDKWFHYRAVLADGTRLDLRRQAGVKTKKGAVVKEKRRLFVALAPNPARYPLEALGNATPRRQLQDRLRRATEAFHDAPEEFRARVEGPGAALRVRVTQEDAPILPLEVFAVVGELMRFLAEVRAAPEEREALPALEWPAAPPARPRRVVRPRDAQGR